MWFKWLLFGLFAIDPILTVLAIGEPRQPISKNAAAVEIAVDALFLWGILTYFK